MAIVPSAPSPNGAGKGAREFCGEGAAGTGRSTFGASPNGAGNLGGVCRHSRAAFTLIEILVASLLLGMLVTILTMIFNQSSIAWRTGVAGVADMDDVRDNMAEIREEADNAFVWGDDVYRTTGLWKSNGDLRDRACDADGSQVASEDGGKWRANVLRGKASSLASKSPQKMSWSAAQNMLSVGQTENPNAFKTYTVNVMSAGPDGKFDTWDDVWSWPDDFE